MKKAYEKPRIIKVSLKVEQTVLGGCKFLGYGGAGPNDVAQNCGELPCKVHGS